MTKKILFFKQSTKVPSFFRGLVNTKERQLYVPSVVPNHLSRLVIFKRGKGCELKVKKVVSDSTNLGTFRDVCFGKFVISVQLFFPLPLQFFGAGRKKVKFTEWFDAVRVKSRQRTKVTTIQQNVESSQGWGNCPDFDLTLKQGWDKTPGFALDLMNCLTSLRRRCEAQSILSYIRTISQDWRRGTCPFSRNEASFFLPKFTLNPQTFSLLCTFPHRHDAGFHDWGADDLPIFATFFSWWCNLRKKRDRTSAAVKKYCKITLVKLS